MPANPQASGSAPPSPAPSPTPGPTPPDPGSDLANALRANALLTVRVQELESLVATAPSKGAFDEQLHRITALETALADAVYTAKREAYLHAKQLAMLWRQGAPDPIDSTVDDLDKKHGGPPS